MQYNEFLVFIARVTYEHYKKTNYHNELMYIKIEKMLPAWLAPVYAQPDFGFHVDFAYDIKMAKKKERLRRRKMGLPSESEDNFDYDSEDDSDEAPAAKGKDDDDEQAPATGNEP
jgi:hypothetical protein